MRRGRKATGKRLCKICGETDPARFCPGKHARCRKCRKVQARDAYRAKQAAAGQPVRVYAERLEGVTAEERALADRFGLTVRQYREALAEE